MSAIGSRARIRNSRQHYVYFAKVGDYLKVGCSYNPPQRVKQIRRDNCSKPADLDLMAPVELMRFVPGGFDLEFQYIAALADHHAEGEWFHATPEVLAWVADLDPERNPWEQRPIAVPTT